MFPCKLCSSECEKFYVVCASCYEQLQAENDALWAGIVMSKKAQGVYAETREQQAPKGGE